MQPRHPPDGWRGIITITMKTTRYSIIVAGVASMLLASCSGQEDYDAYVENLKAQTAVIDTISTPASYAVYLDSLAVKADAFGQLGIKLDPTQEEELTALSLQIQEALTAKYNQLSQQPAIEETILDASAPVAPFAQSDREVELD